jgi:diguanylate cyclase (GGDEF)-like protein
MAVAQLRIPQFRILFVDDSEPDVLLAIKALRDAGLSVDSRRVDTAPEFSRELAAGPWDLVICDHRMPEFDSLSALRLLNRSGQDIPFIIVSGIIPDEVAIAAMREGARDFVNKNNLSRLAPAVEREVREAKNRDLLRQSQAVIERMLRYDALTGLPNGDAFQERLSALIAGGAPFMACLIDLNRFRKIVQGLGMVVGNRALHALAGRLASCCASDDFLARVGTDSFVLLRPGRFDAAVLESLFARLQAALSTPVSIQGQDIRLSCCVGAAAFPEHGAQASELLHSAEAALTQAKIAGPGQARWFVAGMGDSPRRMMLLESALYQAVHNREFVLFYQPQVDLASGRVVGVEALLRWRSPERGLVAPDDFIPTLEESGMIVGVGEWVLREACRQLQAWQAAGAEQLRMAVNLSAVQFQQSDLVAMVGRVLASSGVDPRRIELEITENIAMHNEERLIDTLRALKALGVSLAIDDFGTGYSSLSYLQHFPVDRLKIDRAFIRDALPGDGLVIVRAVVAMGTSLNLAVIAEGIESEWQVAMLRAAGCQEGQGYLYSRPLPAADCASFLGLTAGVA